MYKIDTIGLLQRTFVSLARQQLYRLYRPGRTNFKPTEQSYDVIEVPVEDPGIVKSYLGTPVLMPIFVQPGRYRERLEVGSINFVDYDGYEFPYTTVMEITRPKVIVETQIAGRDGTVKEYISNADFQINLRGIIVNNDSDTPPEAGIRAFHAITSVPAALNFECEMFEWLGFSQAVIYEPRLFQLEGFSHVMGFSMVCKSDQITEVRLRDGL